MAYLKLSGNIPEFRISLQIYVRGDIMYGALIFSVQVEISSYPPVFLDFKDLIIFNFMSGSISPIHFRKRSVETIY